MELLSSIFVAILVIIIAIFFLRHIIEALEELVDGLLKVVFGGIVLAILYLFGRGFTILGVVAAVVITAIIKLA